MMPGGLKCTDANLYVLLLQTPSDHMRTVVVVAMKFTIVDSQQPVDAHLPQMIAPMLNHMQDQDR